jgi:hypothetical protein
LIQPVSILNQPLKTTIQGLMFLIQVRKDVNQLLKKSIQRLKRLNQVLKKPIQRPEITIKAHQSTPNSIIIRIGYRIILNRRIGGNLSPRSRQRSAPKRAAMLL